jgi:hypothetical protein
MGSAVLFSEAQLHSAERVYMDVHPGLARSRTVQRNVPRRVRGESRVKTTLFALLTGGVARSPIARFISDHAAAAYTY